MVGDYYSSKSGDFLVRFVYGNWSARLGRARFDPAEFACCCVDVIVGITGTNVKRSEKVQASSLSRSAGSISRVLESVETPIRESTRGIGVGFAAERPK